MLKIREFHDDGTPVDLKELEKFGWIYDEDDGFLGNDKIPHYYKDFNYYNTLTIYCDEKYKREIFGEHDETITIRENEIIKFGWIDDLIKAGLVEKVDD